MHEWPSEPTEQLIALVRAALTAERLPAAENTDWSALLRAAAKHSLQYIAAQAALGGDMPQSLQPQLLSRMQKICMQSVAVCSTQDYEAERLMRYFEEHGLFLVPIKGVCTRARYPESTIRSMGDLDFLYDARQTKAVRAAMKALGYSDFREGRKHDAFRLPPFVHVELHRELVASENDQYDNSRVIRGRLRPVSGTRHRFRMTLEDEYLFNLIHFAGHVRLGGAGIRFVMDVYVYEQTPLDRAYLRAELEKAGLRTFYENVRAIAAFWFADGAALTDTQEQLARFIMNNGVFGSDGDAAALAVRGGRLSALAQSCFPNYESMRSMYPWLEKAPALLPFSWAMRGCTAVFRRPDHVRGRLRQLLRGDRKKGRDLETFFAACGL